MKTSDAFETSIRFNTTAWTLVFKAALGGEPGARDAWSELDYRYRRPLYAYARARGDSHSVAEERVQGFLASVFTEECFRELAPTGGRLRNWLLLSFNRYRYIKYREEMALKRRPKGGLVSINEPEGESAVLQPDTGNGQKFYEREWAVATLEQARMCLREQYEARGLSARFDVFWPRLHPRSQAGVPGDPAGALGLSPGSFATALSEFRKEYQNALRRVVRQTMEEGDDVDAEIRDLIRAVS